MRDELVMLIEGLALRRPPPTVASIHRQALDVAEREGWPPLTYATVCSIVTALDPALVTRAQRGDAAYRDAFELRHRHEADHPTASGRPTTPSSISSWPPATVGGSA